MPRLRDRDVGIPRRSERGGLRARRVSRGLCRADSRCRCSFAQPLLQLLLCAPLRECALFANRVLRFINQASQLRVRDTVLSHAAVRLAPRFRVSFDEACCPTFLGAGCRAYGLRLPHPRGPRYDCGPSRRSPSITRHFLHHQPSADRPGGRESLLRGHTLTCAGLRLGCGLAGHDAVEAIVAPPTKIGQFPATPYGLEKAPGGVRRMPNALAAHQRSVAEMQGEIQRRVAATRRKEIVVFVHGYNSTASMMRRNRRRRSATISGRRISSASH